jgi:zinc/manganese transport system substrate-binding protein
MRRRQLLASLAALISVPAVADMAMPVVATFSVLGDMTTQIGGAAVTVNTLVGPDADVHTYQPTPGDLRALMDAKLLVTNGLGLEGWLDRLTGAVTFQGTTVVAAAQVKPRTMTEAGGVATTDPHAWQDPRNGVLYAEAIGAGLSTADASRADAFQSAVRSYAAQIKTMDGWIETQFAPIPPERRRIITTHDAFGYYGARFGVEFLAPEGISTEFEPSAKAIAALVAQIRREKIHAVFIENMTSPRMVQMLAQETGAILGGTVYSDALSPKDGPAATYLDMLRHNTRLFVAAMAGP